MKFRARKRITLVPGLFYMNVTQSGISSFTFKLWRYTWNSRTKKSRFDTPGPGYVEWGGPEKVTR